MKPGAIEHPKTEMLQGLLGVRLVEAVGHLEMFWQFTTKYAPAGDIGRWPDSTIAKRCGWDGDPAVFLAALRDAKGAGSQGFIEPHETHRWVVHDWFDHAHDSLHMALYRKGEYFWNGKKPKPARLSQEERAAAEQKYAENAHNAPSVRTVCEQPVPAVRTTGTCRAHDRASGIGSDRLGSDRIGLEDNSCSTASEAETAEQQELIPLEKPKPKDEPFLDYPCSGKPDTWVCMKSKGAEWDLLYGEQVDVPMELRKAKQWLIDNPKKKKTAGGMPSFLNNWLIRAVNVKAQRI